MMADDWVKERHEALMSLDREKITAYFLSQGAQPRDIPPEPGFWVRVHRARIHCATIPEEAKEVSRQWLDSRGYSRFLY